MEDGSSLFVDRNYHGNALDNRKNVVYVRPVAAWQSGAWSVAAAMESNLVNNAYGYEKTGEAGSTSQIVPVTG